MDWLQERLRFSTPFIDTGMPEAIQDRPQVSDFHKAINVALEDNIIRKPASLFCIALNSLSALLNKIAYGYRLKNGTTINPFLYMDDIKLYAKNEQAINSLMLCDLSLWCSVPTSA